MSSGRGGQLIRTPALPTLLRGEDSSDKVMEYQLGAFATCAAVFVYVLLRRCRKLSAIGDVPGPVNPSWIFGMSPAGRPGPFASSRWHIVLSMKPFKDTSGIFRSKKLEEQRGGSSRLSGMLFVGTAHLGYVSPSTNTPWWLAFGVFTETIGSYV